ncbi:hypothetical protein POTOM_031596 [Populus tomentosa]|uniref:Uncharacterized protein n=1 Tax=Populus tomentosa TaxID=118781 RepID=A0A8X7Z2V7_POPTO|nr:hypothetical protein POTOM_031596 [Populus tomentosa]
MASFKAERTMFIKLAGPAKKEPAKLDDSTSKTAASKPDSEKAAQKPQERKIRLVTYASPLDLRTKLRMNEHLTVVITKDQVQGYGQTNSETKPRNTLSAVSGSKLDAIDFTIFEVFFGDSCFIKNVREEHG